MSFDHKVILCAGLNRSGSTWQLNAAHALLQEVHPGLSVRISWIGDYDPADPADVHLVKVHRHRDAAGLGDVILSTYRDLRAVAGSLVRMKWATVDWPLLRSFLDAYVEDADAWEASANLVIPYEKLLDRPAEILSSIAEAMGIDPTPEQIAAVLARLERLAPASDTPAGNLDVFDRETLLHNGHIGGRADAAAMAQLPEALLGQIETRYHDWLVAHRYVLSADRIAACARRCADEVETLHRSSITIPLLTLDPIRLTRSDMPPGLALSGFAAEEWGSWSIAPVCSLIFRTPPDMQAGHIFLNAGAFVPPGTPAIIATVFLNGQEIDRWLWRSLDHQQLRIPFEGLQDLHVLTFHIEGARSARSLDLGEDDRRLGLAVQTIWIAGGSIAA